MIPVWEKQHVSTHTGHSDGTHTEMLTWLLTEAGILGVHLFASLFSALNTVVIGSKGEERSLKKVDKRQTLGQSNIKPKLPDTLLGSQRGSDWASVPTSSCDSDDGSGEGS